jgi:Holliday junction DNA helicase RuvB
MPRGPFHIGEFVGQREALEPVLRTQDGARFRAEPMPHLLFAGESGVGKSLAARELAKRADAEVLTFYGPARADAVAAKLVRARPLDYVYFDEAHGLPHEVQELLYPVIDASARNAAAELPPVRGFIPPVPQQAAGATIPAAEGPPQVPPVTMIFATNKPGELLAALLKRVQRILFRRYTEDELREIVKRFASRRGVLISPQAARLVARMSHGLPRDAEQHLKKLRYHYREAEEQVLGTSHVCDYLRAFGFDVHGLEPIHRQYLRHLGELGRASRETLATLLGTDRDYVSAEIEPPLLRQLLITKGPHGRKLTKKGKALLKARHTRNRRREGDDNEP